jgi:predicted Zn finger-like uncharacterized protein
MFTVCPKCALTLAVAASDLRAGQGYVRCGRCANVFNALLGLSDESAPGVAVPARTLQQGTATPQDRRTEPRPPGPDPLNAPALELSAKESSFLATSPPSDFVELEVDEFRATGTFETIVLEGEGVLQTEELVEEEAVDIEIANVSRRIEAARRAGHLAHIGAPPQVAVEEVAAGAEEEEEGEQEEEEEEPPDEDSGDAVEELRAARHARTGWLGITAAVVLVLALAAQGINHWRNDLATYASWYRPLERITAAIGEPLRPNWDLSVYDVHQLGATSDLADPRSLKVHLSIANRGEREQAWPLVRLSLLDRYGTVVSSGDLKAEEYLPAALRGQHFIASEQRIDTEVSVVDPTQQVSSFELDVCVPAAGGGLRCAGDTPVLSARK